MHSVFKKYVISKKRKQKTYSKFLGSYAAIAVPVSNAIASVIIIRAILALKYG